MRVAPAEATGVEHALLDYDAASLPAESRPSRASSRAGDFRETALTTSSENAADAQISRVAYEVRAAFPSLELSETNT